MSRFPLGGPTILMCPPDHFAIEYEINPWMNRGRPSDRDESRRQWQALYQLLQSFQADVQLMQPVEGLPDLVFTANAGLVFRDRVYLSNFRHGARQGETPVDQAWFEAWGFQTVTIPDKYSFEGAGDALFCGETLFAGYIIRSHINSMQWVAKQMNCRVIPLQLVDDHYYHLDTCFCPLSATEAMYFPPAFDQYAQLALKAAIPNLIEVHPDEAARFACNAVVVGKQVALNTGCPQLEQQLRGRGYEPHATPLDEFIKSGGSAKCLTLRLDGEDAALWPEAE